MNYGIHVELVVMRNILFFVIYDNKRLQLFDFNENFIRLIKCDDNYYDVCIFNNLIYVTMDASVSVFTFEGKLHYYQLKMKFHNEF